MDDSGGPIQLCLVNNNPTSTLLMTPAGQPLYSITTPIFPPSNNSVDGESSDTNPVRPGLADKHRKSSAVDSDSPRTVVPSPPRRFNSLPGPVTSDTKDTSQEPEAESHVRRGSTTIVKRLDDYDVSRGHVETTIGLIKSEQEAGGEAGSERVVLELCEADFKVRVPSPPSRSSPKEIKGKTPLAVLPPVEEGGTWDMVGYASASDGEWVVVEGPQSAQREALESWDFIGPDKKHYKWHMVVHSPVLARVGSSKQYIHIARFRRPKLGIVSRSRKGYLEIYPNANVSMDFIVTSFVGFMKHCVLPSDNAVGPASSSPLNPNAPPRSLTDRSHPRTDTSSIVASSECQSRTSNPSNHTPVDSESSRQVSQAPKVESDGIGLPVRSPISLPPRFVTAVALARKHSRSPPDTAFTFPPFLVKPKIRPVSATVPEDSSHH